MSASGPGRRGSGRGEDLLVHNAGVLPDKKIMTEEGLELTLATNLVGPFLMTRLLLDRMGRSRDARVLLVSSGGMYTKRLAVDDSTSDRGAFDGVQAYARTRRALVVLSELMADRLRGTTVTVHSMHPGWADTPAVRSSLPLFHRVTRSILRNADQGADTVLWLSMAEAPRRLPGPFWFDRTEQRVHWVPGTRERPEERERL